MRARPSTTQNETAEREVSYRLGSQLSRLSTCLAVVLNRKAVDENVLQLVRKVALDTSRGTSLEIITALYNNSEGMNKNEVSDAVNRTWTDTKLFLRFLSRLGAIELITPVEGKRRKASKWRLTEKIRKLYSEVMDSN